jgi:arginase
VALVGIRDLDPAEREHARRFGVRVFTMREVDERGLKAVMEDALALASDGTDGVHVSLDMDWIDPGEAPGVGTPVRGGATYREAHLAMEMLADTARVVSMDVVEINPVLDHYNKTAELAVGLVGSVFGLRIL